MSTRTFAFAPEENYHIYNRGNSKQIIFLTEEDYARFQILLYISNSTNSFSLRNLQKQNKDPYEVERGNLLVSVEAYCLMPNHYHLLLSPLVDNGVSMFMLKLATAYSMYFNKRHDRTGGLFEGRFKSKHADIDEYLKYLFSYIHLNPSSTLESNWREKVRTETKRQQLYNHVSNYKYSSLQDYLNPDSRIQFKIINPKMYRNYFEDDTASKQELFDWLEYEDIAT